MLNLFDFQEGDDKKKKGMKKAAAANPNLELARSIARELCVTHGACTADQVGRVLAERHNVFTLGPAAGSLFKTGEFKPTGRLVRSSRITNHSRLLYEWTLNASETTNNAQC